MVWWLEARSARRRVGGLQWVLPRLCGRVYASFGGARPGVRVLPRCVIVAPSRRHPPSAEGELPRGPLRGRAGHPLQVGSHACRAPPARRRPAPASVQPSTGVGRGCLEGALLGKVLRPGGAQDAAGGAAKAASKLVVVRGAHETSPRVRGGRGSSFPPPSQPPRRPPGARRRAFVQVLVKSRRALGLQAPRRGRLSARCVRA